MYFPASSPVARSYFAARFCDFRNPDGSTDKTKWAIKFPKPRTLTIKSGKTRKSVNMAVRFTKAAGLKGTKRAVGNHNLIVFVSKAALKSARVEVPTKALENTTVAPNYKPSNLTRRK